MGSRGSCKADGRSSATGVKAMRRSALAGVQCTSRKRLHLRIFTAALRRLGGHYKTVFCAARLYTFPQSPHAHILMHTAATAMIADPASPDTTCSCIASGREERQGGASALPQQRRDGPGPGPGGPVTIIMFLPPTGLPSCSPSSCTTSAPCYPSPPSLTSVSARCGERCSLP